MIITVEVCTELLRKMDNILILTHLRPDGDTLGSACALCHSLRAMGKTAWIYPNPEITGKYRPYTEPYAAPEQFHPEHVVAVDLADTGLFPKGYAGNVELCIDHHPSNSGYAASTLLDGGKASCGEIIYKLLLALRGTIDKEEANLLYIAVSTDTGCFCYANTKADTLRTAAELMDAGAENAELNHQMFRTFTRSRLVLEGLIYAGMRSYRGDQINIAVVTRDMMQQAGATENDCDDLAGLPGRVAGNRVSVTIRELEDGSSKLSVRSFAEVDSSAICARFGGGGHAMAAGCTMACGPEEAADIILRAILEVME